MATFETVQPRRWSLTPLWWTFLVVLVTQEVTFGGAGLVVGWRANPATAWFAIIELAVLAAPAGLLVAGLAVLVHWLARRRFTTSRR